MMRSLERSFIPTSGLSGSYSSHRCMAPYYPLSPYRSICIFTHTNAISKFTSPPPLPSVVRPTLLYFWLACHAALDAASGLCFSGFLLEFIPMKIGAGMTIIVKGFMAQYTRGVNYYMLWVIIRCRLYFGPTRGMRDNFLKRPTRCEVTSPYRLPSVSGCLFEGPREQRK